MHKHCLRPSRYKITPLLAYFIAAFVPVVVAAAVIIILAKIYGGAQVWNSPPPLSFVSFSSCRLVLCVVWSSTFRAAATTQSSTRPPQRV
jgi:membrane protein implicated in regulation of membrane protease activity